MNKDHVIRFGHLHVQGYSFLECRDGVTRIKAINSETMTSYSQKFPHRASLLRVSRNEVNNTKLIFFYIPDLSF